MTDPSGLFGVAGVSVSISISGAPVGCILGALLEAVKHADMVVNGNNIDPTDTTLSIIIGAMEGAAKGLGNGGFKDWATFGAFGKI
jgi:hypothetical protein